VTEAMARPEAMKQLLQGIADDAQDYAQLLVLLEQQFRAAIGHKLAALAEVAEQLGTLTTALETRRAHRVALAAVLAGPQPSMEAVFALLRPDARARVLADWAALEQQVITAKTLSRRNGDLMADQYTIMQRVLHGDDQTYEPA
jgi:flagellar biosynthesis protein FlgN